MLSFCKLLQQPFSTDLESTIQNMLAIQTETKTVKEYCDCMYWNFYQNGISFCFKKVPTIHLDSIVVYNKQDRYKPFESFSLPLEILDWQWETTTNVQIVQSCKEPFQKGGGTIKLPIWITYTCKHCPNFKASLQKSSSFPSLAKSIQENLALQIEFVSSDWNNLQNKMGTLTLFLQH